MPDDQTSDALLQAVLARFPGAEFEIRAVDPSAPRPGRVTSLHDRHFGAMAPALWDRGWPVYPQSRRGRDRLTTERTPARIFGSMIQTGCLTQALPDEARRREWVQHAPSHNVALMLGMHGLVALDVDVRMPELSGRIEAIIRETLPESPFWRASDGAKRVVLLRSDPSDPIMRKSEHTLLDDNGEPVVDSYGKACAIEVLAAGSSITIGGLHHATGGYLTWSRWPSMSVPEDAPLVTATALRACLERISETVCRLTRLGRGYDGYGAREAAYGEVSPATVDASGIVSPGNRGRYAKGTFNAEGKLVDGREGYVLSRSMTYCIANSHLMHTPAGRHAVAGALFAECKEVFDGLGGGRYTSWGDDGRGGNAATSVLHDCRAKVESAKGKLLSDIRERPKKTSKVDAVTVRTGVGVDRGAADPMSWVSSEVVSIKAISVADQAAKRLARAIVTDPEARAKEQARVSREVTATVDRFLDQAAAEARGKAPLQDLLLLKAPVGAGKTSSTVERLAARRRARGPLGKVILMFMPSYANIDEVAARASSKRTPPGTTQVFRDAVNDARAEAEGMGLKVGVLTGMERAGCLMKEQRAFLRTQGAPAHGLCHAKVRQARGMEGVDVYCDHHPEKGGSCPVIAQRKSLADCDLVLLPTAFLTIGVPEVLKDAVAGMIVDERCVFEILHYDHMPLDDLLLARPEPRVLPCDGEGVTPQDLLMERDRAAQFVHAALVNGDDPATAIHLAGDETLLADVKSAKTVASRAMRAAMEVQPNLSLEYLQRVFDRAEAKSLRQEARMWDTIIERLDQLRNDSVVRGLAAAARTHVDPCMLQARGARDARLQVIAMGEATHLRVSWRDDPILAELPTLLLDASADAGMVEKAWNGRDVEVVQIDAYLHLHTVVCLDSTWSTMSLVPSMAPGDRRVRAGKNLVTARRAANSVAHVHGAGRVAVAMPMKPRRAFQAGHAEAANIDLMHYGAVRGLDFAKDHRAVMTIGRHEFPVWIVDAIAASLTYDDIAPEAPFDALGTGLGTDDKPISVPMVDRVLPLRDGRDLTIQVPQYPGRWSAAVQRQFREEELLQAMGRLRPVYREDVGTWIAMSRIVPEGVIVDAVTSGAGLAQAKGAGLAYEAIRRAGVADPRVIERVAKDVGADLKAAGLLGTDTSGVMARGMDAWSITVDGVADVVQVPGYVSDVGEIVEAYDRAGLRVDSLRMVSEAKGKTPSQPKPADKVDEEIGSRDERRAQEDEDRAAALAVRGNRGGDVEVEMILARQCEMTPTEASVAVQMAAEADGDEGDEDATPEAAARPPSAPRVVPGSPASLAAMRARPRASEAASNAVAVSSWPASAPRPLRLAPGLSPRR